ncbi:MAG: hypothetical protein NXI13_11510 [Proteobacteria bacterium]|nr:hypothetical protein [Pseudomonadota bacterium]
MLKSIARFFLILLLSAAAFFLLSDLYFSYGMSIIGGADAAPLLILALLVVLSLIVGTIVSKLIRHVIWPRSRVVASALVLLSTVALGWQVLQFSGFGTAAAPSQVVVAKPIVPTMPSKPTTGAVKKPSSKAPTVTKKPSTAGKVTTKPTAKKKNGIFSKAKNAVKKGVSTVKKSAKKITGTLSGQGSKSATVKPKPSPQPVKQGATASPFRPDDGYPVFPDNPPIASAREVIPNRFFLKEGEPNPTLKQVSDKILKALDAGGYYETSFYRFRENGFALATKLEKIHEDGTPIAGDERWSADIKPRFDISFTEYLSSLFLAKTGYYRIIVFIVSEEAFSQSGDADREVAEAWVSSGANALQKDIAKAEFTEDHLSTALVYVFEKPETEPSKFAGNWLQGKTHLEKAKLWSALSQ